MRPVPRGASRAGFSLIEIVLAIGIISFALVGIMGLFPAAISAARDSQRDTQATLIAQRIFADLRAEKPFILKAADDPKPSDFVQFTTKTTTAVSYDESGWLSGATPMGKSAPISGSPTYSATIVVTPSTPIPGLTKVEVTLGTPVAASAAHQKTYRFLSLLHRP